MFPAVDGLRASLLVTGPPENGGGGGALEDLEGEMVPGIGRNPLK